MTNSCGMRTGYARSWVAPWQDVDDADCGQVAAKPELHVKRPVAAAWLAVAHGQRFGPAALLTASASAVTSLYLCCAALRQAACASARLPRCCSCRCYRSGRHVWSDALVLRPA